MNRVEEIEAAIDGLPPEEYRRTVQWFREPGTFNTPFLTTAWIILEHEARSLLPLILHHQRRAALALANLVPQEGCLCANPQSPHLANLVSKLWLPEHRLQNA